MGHSRAVEFCSNNGTRRASRDAVRGALAHFIRFSVVGLSGALIDTTLLQVFESTHLFGFSLMINKIIAAEIAMLNNFVWNEAWTFRVQSSRVALDGGISKPAIIEPMPIGRMR